MTMENFNEMTEAEKGIQELKSSVCSLESLKEISMTIYLPVQLAIWTLGRIEINGVDIRGYLMLLFSLILSVY